MNFDKTRFANFARYDLTINKAFFRNMLLVTIAGAVGIAMIGFMARYNIYRDVVTNPYEWGSLPAPGDFSHYTWNYITTLYELGFFALMMAIFAGCWAHNLRGKQGRITELTLPATNLEKFTWHTLLTLVGGFLLCIVSLLIADGLNALLTLMMFSTANGIGSLTQSTWALITFTTGDSNFMSMPAVAVNGILTQGDMDEIHLCQAVTFCIIASAILETVIFFFGNALKYKYNIILTYIALQVIGTVGTFLFFIFTAIATGEAIDYMDNLDVEGSDIAHFFIGTAITVGIIAILLSALLVWWSYKRYKKAQITSALNK